MNARQIRFCHEYIKDLNGTAAARRAGYTGTDASLATEASRLLRNAEVKARIDEAKKRREERTKVDADTLLLNLQAVAFGDPRKIVEHRRRCCRHCWGKGHKWQFTDTAFAEEKEKHERRLAEWDKNEDPDKGDGPGEFDEKGGPGFDRSQLPHEKCPECKGEGVPEVFIRDTDALDEDALAMFKSIEVTKDGGIKVHLHDQMKAREMLGRHLKLFSEVIEVKGLEGLAGRIAAAQARIKGRNKKSEGK